MKSKEVCVDAGLAIKVIVPETGSDKADALFDLWAGEETQLIAPVFFEVIANQDYTFSGAKRTCMGNRSRVSIPNRLRRYVSSASRIASVRILDG